MNLIIALGLSGACALILLAAVAAVEYIPLFSKLADKAIGKIIGGGKA